MFISCSAQDAHPATGNALPDYPEAPDNSPSEPSDDDNSDSLSDDANTVTLNTPGPQYPMPYSAVAGPYQSSFDT
eukprot:6684456-Alexandrium_andersonii.AAC.1